MVEHDIKPVYLLSLNVMYYKNSYVDVMKNKNKRKYIYIYIYIYIYNNYLLLLSARDEGGKRCR